MRWYRLECRLNVLVDVTVVGTCCNWMWQCVGYNCWWLISSVIASKESGGHSLVGAQLVYPTYFSYLISRRRRQNGKMINWRSHQFLFIVYFTVIQCYQLIESILYVDRKYACTILGVSLYSLCILFDDTPSEADQLVLPVWGYMLILAVVITGP